MAVTVRMPKLHPGQREVFDHPARFKVLACGRRWGKTRLGALLCVAEALRGGTAWWVAPSYKVAAVGWRLLKRLATQLPGTQAREVDRIVEFPGGGWLQVRSADDPDSLRGEGLDLVVMDECAFISELAWTEALRPALADKQGKALFISTPKGRNWFWRMFQRGMDPAVPDWQAWSKPSVSNPFIKPEEIEAAKADVSEREAKQEFDAEFLEDGGEVFRNVRKLSVAVPLEGPQDGRRYCMGVDLGRKSDFTVLKIMDITDGADAVCTEVHMDRFNKVLWDTQVSRIAAAAQKFGVRDLWVDATGVGDPVVKDIAKALPGTRVNEMVFTAVSRHQVLDNLALRYEKETIRALYDEVSIGEKEAFIVVKMPSGVEKYAVPDKMHDDTTFAEALAVWPLNKTKRTWGAVQL